MTWEDLTAICPLEPIRSKEQYRKGRGVLDKLLELDRDPLEELYLQVLAILVHDYACETSDENR